VDASERQTRTHLMRMFDANGFHPRSDLGQNFLIDLNLIEFVVRHAELDSRDVALEIGTGTGGMTTFLAAKAGHVVTVEVDKNVYKLALEATAGMDNVTHLLTDALKNKNQLHPDVLEAVQRELARDPDRRLKLTANLPYHVAAPIIGNLIATGMPWDRMVVTVQFEMAERMMAPPRTAEYGAMAIWLQSQCRIQILKKLGPQVFWPRPQVDSAVVLLTPDPEKAAKIENREFFHDFLRRVFTLRRKHLCGAMVTLYKGHITRPQVVELLEGLKLGENTRAEEVDVATLVELSNRMVRLIGTACLSDG
jgi:16S rRNA (adenine1518-N6/adenine1519-N6)-dimethyltransferase